MPSISATDVLSNGISRTCKFARVVTWQNGPQSSLGEIGYAGENCQCFMMPFGIRSRHM